MEMVTETVCMHCKRTRKLRNKGLCRNCYYKVRDIYPSLPREPRPITRPTSRVRHGARACAHCELRAATGRSKLCQRCRSTPEVRSQYLRAGQRICEQCGYRHVPAGAPADQTLCADCKAGRPIPERIREANALLPTVDVGPICAPGGSAERLAVLIARSEAGLPLFDRRDTVSLE